jgi:hypothetical protein
LAGKPSIGIREWKQMTLVLDGEIRAQLQKIGHSPSRLAGPID